MDDIAVIGLPGEYFLHVLDLLANRLDIVPCSLYLITIGSDLALYGFKLSLHLFVYCLKD